MANGVGDNDVANGEDGYVKTKTITITEDNDNSNAEEDYL